MLSIITQYLMQNQGIRWQEWRKWRKNMAEVAEELYRRQANPDARTCAS